MRLPLVGLVVLLVGAFAAIAVADRQAQDRLADGLTVGGIPVGGLTQAEARERVAAELDGRANRPAVVRVAGQRFTLSARRAGVRYDVASAVRRAYARGREGALPVRGWRALTGAEVRADEPVSPSVDRAAIERFVTGIHVALARKPVPAELRLTLTSVAVTGGTPGRRLAGRDDLVERLVARMQDPRADRRLRGRMITTKAKVDRDALFDENPVAVTVSRESKVVRVFRRGKLETTYRVAVGQPQYPTPTGQFTVQSMQVDPAWSVPDSEWAGDLAGQVIPGGAPNNPLVARWIGFNGSVGFHGTPSVGSLGSAASHGCVRMAPDDVKDLYERVQVGTPVLVA
jgi:lipoprotein-anchoring transpeptidase ErfK/SrfK